jgi:hypothetical protein
MICPLLYSSATLMHNIAIVGSRSINDNSLTDSIRLYHNTRDFLEQHSKYPDITVVSGGARGVDRLAEDVAYMLDLPTIIIPAKWNLYGKRAGLMRNSDIIDASDEILAIWDGESPGTLDSLFKAALKDIPITIWASGPIDDLILDKLKA